MNLIPFALFSQKIPEYYLVPQKKKGEHAKNLFSLSLDMFFLLNLCGLITAIATEGLNTFLFTFSSKYSVVFPTVMYLLTFPLLTFAYYLVCLHCADGMSMGMRMTKKRLVHTSFDDHEASMAMKMTMTLMSLGLTYPLIAQSLNSKDYRYTYLMEIKDQKVDLHALIKEREHEEVEEFQIAA